MINLVSKIASVPNIASMTRGALGSIERKTIPTVTPFFHQFLGQSKNSSCRSFSTSVITKAEQGPTPSKTVSYVKEFGRQLVINAPAFLALAVLNVVLEDAEPPPKSPSEKPAN